MIWKNNKDLNLLILYIRRTTLRAIEKFAE